ncbi:MAG: hypothetical protein IPM24_04510 [Bryobacterales bacterium]|nr:hypothetical protein [Bryobacterales bacterium]
MPAYLRRPVSFEAAKEALRQRLALRRQRFLDRFRLDVFGQPDSPYHALLRHAGCEWGDVAALVEREGVEATLQALFRAGVYLTIDEFKGRRPARRGSLEIAIQPEMLRAPRASYHLPAASGGTRSSGTPVLIDLEFIRTCAANCAVCLDAWGGRDWVKGDWESPGAGARFRVVKFAGFGALPRAAFSFFDTATLPAYFRWNLKGLHWASRLGGRPLPRTVCVPHSNPAPLLEWLVQVLRGGETPCIFTFSGAAVTACLAARERGYDIAGSVFLISGEPVTAARIRTIASAGCRAIPRYGTVEVGAIGYGCRAGRHPDEVHFLEDMHALIHAGEEGAQAGLPPKALLMTSIHPQSPFVMINLSMGDQAEMGARACGCPLDGAGWRTHLWDIRSFEKLTAAGVTFLGSEVIAVLEEALPARFGGGPTDYQLVESETETGLPVLRLRAHPRLGDLPAREVVDTFAEVLGRSSQSKAMMVRRWLDAGTLQFERAVPAATRAGKIQFLHVEKRPAG